MRTFEGSHTSVPKSQFFKCSAQTKTYYFLKNKTIPSNHYSSADDLMNNISLAIF